MQRFDNNLDPNSTQQIFGLSDKMDLRNNLSKERIRESNGQDDTGKRSKKKHKHKLNIDKHSDGGLNSSLKFGIHLVNMTGSATPLVSGYDRQRESSTPIPPGAYQSALQETL